MGCMVWDKANDKASIYYHKSEHCEHYAGGEFLGDAVKMQMIHCYDHRGEPIKFADLSDDYQSLVKDNLPSDW